MYDNFTIQVNHIFNEINKIFLFFLQLIQDGLKLILGQIEHILLIKELMICGIYFCYFI
jgi:hypothetical protein